jgi:hypothetical protein
MAEALVPFADGRSTQVITRIRGGRGRSGLPTSLPHMAGLAEGAAAPGVWANPFPALGNVAEPALPTDVAVSLTPPPGEPTSRTSRAPLIVAFTVLLLLCAVGGIVAARRSAMVTVPATRGPVGTAGVRISGGATDREQPAPAIPSTVAESLLEPLPSAATLPPPTVPSSNVASTPAPTAPSKVHLPQSLNGVQPHF